MEKKFIRIILSVFFLIVLLFTTGSAVADSTSDPHSNWLFKEVEGTASLDFANDPTIARNRFAAVNLGLIHGAEVGDKLVLNFFEDASFTAILGQKHAGAGDGYTWIGRLEGVPLGTFALAIKDGQMAGSVSVPEGAYAIRYAGNGVHALQQIDQTKFPAEAEPIPVEIPEDAIAAAADQPMLDDGSVIDVMVVWTPAARTAAGGTTAMENLVNLAVAEANQSYLNSGINPQLNLVAMDEVPYTESGDMGTDLVRLQNPSDGYMDYIHTARDIYYADQVAMIVESSQYCGIAYMMSTVSTAFEANAFSVVARTCATGYYSYAHELGHNQGARHDWYVDDTLNAPYSYDKGFVYIPGQWRTIMAYNNECADAGIYCTRLQYWSNPDVLYGGIPMGVPIGTSSSCVVGVHPTCDADNRQTLNNTAWTVANFRDRGASTIGPMVYDGHTVDDDNSGNSSGNDNGIVDCGETIELYTTLWNQGIDPATSVYATISTSDPYITWLYNTTSSYPDIPAGGTGDNTDDYDFAVDPGTPHGHIINFNLDITAASGGPWSDSFEVPVSCMAAFPEIEVTPPSFTVNLNVGQTTTEILTIENLGGAPLEFNIYDVETGTPDLRGDSVRKLNDGPVPSSDDPDAFPSLKTESQILAGAPLELNLNDGEIALTDDLEAFPVVKTQSQILAGNPVLIIQDYDPWGYASIRDILTAHGIGYDLVDSSMIPSIDLSPYTMVIIPSVQGDTFYTTFNAYIYKFEDYVSNGGKLWQSTCNYSGETEPLVPGGAVSADDPDYYNVLIEPGHPWVSGVPSPFEGSYASHDSFSSLYPGSIVVAAAQTSSNPTLVDYRYGAGRVLITGQTLEIAWGISPPWDGAPILENSLLELYNTPLAADVLIIQDHDPWSSTGIKDILNAHGIAFHLADSSMIPTIDLSPYTMVIIPSVQGDTFYTTLNAYIYKFEDYISNGGKLWQSTCNMPGAIEPSTPGGVVSADDLDDYNILIEPGHPWVAGVPSPFYGTSASHDSFSNLYPGSLVVAAAQTSGNPTLVDYHYGAGRVLITGQTLEFAWYWGWESAPILENSLLDLYYDPLSADVLILQDHDPWGTTSTKDILNAHGIGFNLADSSMIPTINLAAYRMVIIPGQQDDSFYSTFNANIGKFEAYVNAGGRLWQSTCNYSSVVTEPLVPGGVVSATDLDSYNLILEPAHPWVLGIPSPFYGNYASHDSFSSLYPGSIVVATAQTSGKPTLVDYRYGAGMMLITGQTLEVSWYYGWEGAPILEYSLIDLYNRASGPDAPWLTENPVTGTIPAQDSALVDVTFDATGLVPGTYTANIVIANNDPDENPTIVPVTLNVGGCPGGPNLDYFTTQDNENNALSGYGDCDMDVYLFNDDPLVPIEFNIFIPDTTGVNELMINAFDVDETSEEVDEVYFNGHFAGTLTGADATWSTTVLPLDPAWVGSGNNLVTILVDVTNPDPIWAVNVDWGQVNKVVPTAHIRYVDIGSPPHVAGTTMAIEVEVDTDLASQDLRTEVNLRNPGGVILDGQVIYHTVNGANNDSVVANLTIPAGELGPGYDIQVLVFDAVTSRFQDAEIVQFEVSPQSQTQLWVDPAVKGIPFEGTDTVDLIVTDVDDLYGISLELAFEPSIVEVVSITPGTCPSPDFIVQNNFDNTNGKIFYDVTSLSPSAPCTGGVIATIEFRGKTINVSPLNFVNWLLSDTNGFTIPVLDIHNGELNVVFVHGFVNGFIQMQGRIDHGGAEVCAWDGPTLIDCTTTVADGSYELQLLPGTYDITVEMGRYLDSEYPGVSVASGSPTSLPSVVLPGGDGNDDDVINILDLSFMAARYLCAIGDPCYDPRGDINNDGIINIQDLALTGGNYGKTSPVSWL